MPQHLLRPFTTTFNSPNVIRCQTCLRSPKSSQFYIFELSDIYPEILLQTSISTSQSLKMCQYVIMKFIKCNCVTRNMYNCWSPYPHPVKTYDETCDDYCDRCKALQRQAMPRR